jgi:hypothetical protein
MWNTFAKYFISGHYDKFLSDKNAKFALSQM